MKKLFLLIISVSSLFYLNSCGGDGDGDSGGDGTPNTYEITYTYSFTDNQSSVTSISFTDSKKYIENERDTTQSINYTDWDNSPASEGSQTYTVELQAGEKTFASIVSSSLNASSWTAEISVNGTVVRSESSSTAGSQIYAQYYIQN